MVAQCAIEGGTAVADRYVQIAKQLAALAERSSEELEVGLAQGLYGAQERPLVELELRRRREWDQEEHVIAQLRQRVAELEQELKDTDANLRHSTTLAKIAMVIAGVFLGAWLVEIGPIIWQIIVAPD